MDKASWRRRLYADYDIGASVEEVRAGFAQRAPYLRRLVARHFPADRGAAIADLGCGTGQLVAVAREAGYRNVRGWDHAPGQLALARALGIDGVGEGELMATVAGFADASHDAIVTFDVIEHLDDGTVLDLADHVHRVLRPGGRWLVHVPNGESPFVGRVLHGDLTHERAYTRGALAQLGHAAGFAAVSCHEDTPAVHGPVSAVRWLLWKGLRGTLRFCVAVESGDAGRDAVFSQNVLAVFVK